MNSLNGPSIVKLAPLTTDTSRPSSSRIEELPATIESTPSQAIVAQEGCQSDKIVLTIALDSDQNLILLMHKKLQDIQCEKIIPEYEKSGILVMLTGTDLANYENLFEDYKIYY